MHDVASWAVILLAAVPLAWVCMHCYRRILEVKMAQGTPDSVRAEIAELRGELRNLRETLYHQTVAVEYALSALRIPPEESNRLER
jgi:hypothetical protein